MSKNFPEASNVPGFMAIPSQDVPKYSRSIAEDYFLHYPFQFTVLKKKKKQDWLENVTPYVKKKHPDL